MIGKTMIWKIVAIVAVIGLFTVATAIAAEETITGTLEKTDQGIVLSADNGERLAVSGQDVSNLVGKSVKATGTVMEDSSGMSIKITSIQEISEDAPMKDK